MFIGAIPPASTRADWSVTRQVVDEDTDDLLDLTGGTIVFEVRDCECGRTLLSGTTDNGKVTIDDVGTFTVSFPASDMNTVCAGTYDVGCTITLNGVVYQFIIGRVDILDGITRT